MQNDLTRLALRGCLDDRANGDHSIFVDRDSASAAFFLAPASFGIIGIASSVVGIITVLVNVGIDDIIIQRNSAASLWTKSASIVTLSLGFAASLILVCLSPLFSFIYEDSNLKYLIIILSISIPISTISTIPRCYYDKVYNLTLSHWLT